MAKEGERKRIGASLTQAQLDLEKAKRDHLGSEEIANAERRVAKFTAKLSKLNRSTHPRSAMSRRRPPQRY